MDTVGDLILVGEMPRIALGFSRLRVWRAMHGIAPKPGQSNNA